MRNLSLQYNNNNYYPFGLQHGSYNTPARDYRPIGDAREVETVDRNLYKYKYNGKEYQDELGLDWYDYGARNYDASLGRWMNVDPLESKYAGMSSYNYGFNNSIMFVDHNGREPTPATLISVAKKLNVSVAAIRAVYQVETGGNAFRSNGDPKVLFERHYFHRFTDGRYDESHPSISNRSMGGWGKYSEQITKLELAVSLDAEAGYKSASYGGFQIMGANYEKAGYDNVFDFAEAMLSKNEDLHLEAFANFIMDNEKLLEALQNKDWKTFARIYNGPDYKINNYDVKMEKAYEVFLKIPFEAEKSNINNNFPPPVDFSIEGSPK